jgi:uncharacterized membrane protein
LAGPRSLVGLLAGQAVHLVGITIVLAAHPGWPLWPAPLVLLAILLPQIPLLARRQRPHLAALAPLGIAYAAAGLKLLYRWLGLTVMGWHGSVFPNPMTSLFYLDGIVLAVVAYSLLCQVYLLAKELERPAILWTGAVAGLLLATSIWSGVVYFGKRTHGATASDPYAYAQMAVDLAERGTFLHRFSLFEEVIPLGIAWAPLQPVGYHIPRNALGDCPSVWATGASVLLAAGYKLLGETGLYVTTPVVGLLALAATWFLVQEALRGQSRAMRFMTAGLAVVLLATSPEYVDRLLVPMADAAAALFTVLTLALALGGMRQLSEGQHGLGWFLLAGIAFAWAYWVRHTQIVLAIPVLLAMALGVRKARSGSWSSILSSRPFLAAVFAFLGAALLFAVPDIFYRWQVFGSPWATETTELALMSVQNIVPAGSRMLRVALIAGEWGYLFPLAAYGLYRLVRDHRPVAAILGSAFAVVLLVHLTYSALRLRDLISLFPLVDVAVAYGAVVLIRKVRASARLQSSSAHLAPPLLALTVTLWVISSLGLARWAMIDNLWERGWASFGYMRQENRAAFDRLAELTPPEAIIGASLDAGAVTMYTGRDAIRPYDSWTGEEWALFLKAMRTAGRPVYLLDDGGLMDQFIEQERTRFTLTPIAELQVPLFSATDRETGWLYRLEWKQ